MDNLAKAELTASIHHTARFLKPGILIYNTEVSDTACGKRRRRGRTQSVAKCFPLHVNAIKSKAPF